ncbi:MAG: prepilin-type N-terminal cleavage/methylation domain-containing protein [Candidatus Omnitrophica bacterium]|nr:prepilin-type N-terminal cleavage/methylation domain-containing protein [Candidatus Omnitrophota bacterium]
MIKNKAFTLMEMLIAVTIFTVIAVSLFSAFRSGTFGYRSIEEAIDLNQSVLSALNRLDSDVRNCFSYSINENKFSGGASSISFLTLTDVFNGKGMEQKYAFVSYAIKDNKLMRLCRLDGEALDQNSSVMPEEMLDNAQIKFEYGHVQTGNSIVYVSSWTDPKALPACIKVVLTAAGLGKANKVFERTIYLMANK